MPRQLKLMIDTSTQVPLYRQLIGEIQRLVASGEYLPGDLLPSMNEMSQEHSISRETVKKAYSILREKGVIESAQGKGFYIQQSDGPKKIRVLMLFDKLSTYKLVLSRSFAESVSENVNVTIDLHNQDIEVFENLLSDNIGHFDYYIITPHFPLDTATQSRLIRNLKKIPNRKLIILDRKMDSLKGIFGSVYQDFEQDIYRGLMQGKSLFRQYKKINAISTRGSLYSSLIEKGIEKFCRENHIAYQSYQSINPTQIKKGEIYIVLNSQLDIEIIEIIKAAKARGLKIGEDIGIVSYNESPINEIILDGLTVLSTDFTEMGKRAAEMVMSARLEKIWNKFDLIVRKTL